MADRTVIFFGFPKAIPQFAEIVDRAAEGKFNTIHWNTLQEEEKEAALQKADYFLVLGTRITKEMIEAAPRLRMIQRTGIGYDNVDIRAAQEKGIPVAIFPSGNAVAVAEHAILLTLALYRHLTALDVGTRAGEWPAMKYRLTSHEMDGKVHGFIGFGNIGKLTARRSKGFGTRIVYYDIVRASEDIEKEIGAEYLPLDELLRQSDIVSLHMNLTEDNHKFIGMKELEKMKDSAILINVSRGGLVDEEALCTALETGMIAGAGLDTFSTDPIPPGSRILSFDNVVATPHVAAGTMDTFEKQAVGSMDLLFRADQNEPLSYVVNGIESPRFL